MATVPSTSPKPSTDQEALKLAVAIALLRSKQLGQQSSSAPSDLEADAQRWKKKAKDRKRELVILREELKQLEESGREAQPDAYPQIMSCRCHFFDGCGTLGSGLVSSGGEGGGVGGGNCDHWIDDVLRRRFLRHVRWKERQRRPEGSARKRHCIDLNDDDEMEHLTASVDFIVELSGSVFPDKGNSIFSASSHQAVDSILVSLKKLLLSKKDDEIIEEVVNSLITRLIQRMCITPAKDGSSPSGSNSQLYAQHLIRKLGNEPFVGQRALLFVSQRILSLADCLTVTDPFDDAFPDMHECMFLMIQLTEFMILDNLLTWTTDGNLDSKLFEEWLRSILQARKAFGVLEYRNGLYLIYLERIIGEVAAQAASAVNIVVGKLMLGASKETPIWQWKNKTILEKHWTTCIAKEIR